MTESIQRLFLSFDLILLRYLVRSQSLPRHQARSPVQQQPRRANEVAQQNRVTREHSPPQSVEPYPSSYKQVPCQDVTPLLRHKVGISHHVQHGSLGIASGVENVVELGHGGGPVRLDDRRSDDEEVDQAEKGHQLCESAAHEKETREGKFDWANNNRYKRGYSVRRGGDGAQFASSRRRSR